VRGNPRERGRAHGEQARDWIAAMVAEHFAFLEFSADYILKRPLSRRQILEIGDEYLAACERYAPDLVDEVRGIAEASNVPFREIISLNTFIDVADLVRPETAQNYTAVPANGCTSFGVMPPAAGDGRVYLGQTFDTKAVFKPYTCVLQVEDSCPTDCEALPERAARPTSKSLVATFAGIVGCAGLNAAGVGVVMNHLHTHDARPGVPFTFAVRKILQAASMVQALQGLESLEPASGVNFILADETGVRGTELAPTRREMVEPRGGWLGHANHCLAPNVRAVEVEPSVYSLARGERADTLLARHAGRIDKASLSSFLRDHQSREDTICSHVEADAPRLRQYMSDWGVILDLHARTMDMYVGNPCEENCFRVQVG
jgi:isopenicillin-N N-acyltransferase-like protein